MKSSYARRVELDARPLTQAEFARFGDVLSADRSDVSAEPANGGTAMKRARLAALVNDRASATANLSVFRCSPESARPVPLRVLEKHPSSTQMFVPMNAERYLVVVAEGEDAPDLSTLAAFVAIGTQAITYRAGIWHHPMIALDAIDEGPIDFVCLVFDDGTASDCVEAPPTDLPAVRVGG